MNIQKLFEEFKTKHGREPEAWELSTHEARCGTNKCPLYCNHPNYSKWEVMPSDPEKKCSMNKPDRKRIGEFFKLKNKGLTEREFNRQKAWANLPESEKERRIAVLKKNSPFVKQKQKRHIITQLNDYSSQIALQTGKKDATATPGGVMSGVQMTLEEEK